MKTILPISTQQRRRYNKLIILPFLSIFIPIGLSAQMILDNGFEAGVGVDWSTGFGTVFRGVPVFATSSSDSREGIKAIHFFSHQTDNQSELVMTGGLGNYDWGEEYWIGFSFKQVTDFDSLNSGDNYGVIFRHHGTPHTDITGNAYYGLCTSGIGNGNGKGAAGVPNSFTTQIKGNDLLIHTSTDASQVDVNPPNTSGLSGTELSTAIPIQIGKWYDVVMHFRYDTLTTGFMEVWINETKVVNLHNTVTVYKKDQCGLPRTPIEYQKFGIAHGDKVREGEVLFDAFRSGKGASIGYNDVAPKGLRPGYCPSTATDTTGSYIRKVSVNSDDKGETGSSGYSDFTTSFTRKLERGDKATIEVFPNGMVNINTDKQGYSIWADYDQDGDFADPGEFLGSQLTKTNGKFFVTIPATALLGNTTIRIAMKRDSIPTLCETFTNGEVEDYTITIVEESKSLLENPVGSAVLYPNPTSGNITLKIPVVQNGWSYQVITLTGEVVKEGTLNDSINSLNLKTLDQGLYFLKFTSDQKTEVHRVVKQ